MQLTPRYGTDPVLVMDGDPSAIGEPAVRQRRRLADTLATLTDDQWNHPSRCDGWSARDVIVHLAGTNSFWALAITEGLRGAPTRYLATFDPVASPAQMVAGSPMSNAETLDRFVASSEAFAAVLDSLAGDEWSALAEAPPGHISVSAMTHHAMWDAWVHERDVLIPLGIAPVAEPDEVTACLRYGAALGPALARNRGLDRRGALAIEATDPDVRCAVSIGDRIEVLGKVDDPDLVLRGDAVELLEAFSVRRAFPEVPVEHRWMLGGLTTTFDQTSA